MKTPFIRLGVNIDHVATLRQARGTLYPDPIYAAMVAELAGADGITVHLREDRRHIQERDVHLLQDMLTVRLNLEMAATPAMIDFALALRPTACCIVPERRAELTTEGGLNAVANELHLREACGRLADAGIEVSLFIDPDFEQIDAAKRIGVPVIELHTGVYAEATTEPATTIALAAIKNAAAHADNLGLQVNAGHGLHYHNVQAMTAIPQLVELNIGHAIVARALFTGFSEAVSSMKALMKRN